MAHQNQYARSDRNNNRTHINSNSNSSSTHINNNALFHDDNDHHRRRRRDEMTEIRQQLQQVVGVDPSDHWFDDCYTALCGSGSSSNSSSSNDNSNLVNAIVQQIINHDLRDVVRTSFAQSNENVTSIATSTNNNSTVSLCAQQLRHAVQMSLLETHHYQAQIPPSFGPFLIQIEELLDISANAETRLLYGPSKSYDPTPVGNQHHRCLKMVATDGYYAHGTSFFDHHHSQPPIIVNNNNANDNNDENHNPISNNATISHPILSSSSASASSSSPIEKGEVFVLMEVTPIPNLSVNSRAGIKMILRGPLMIRRGMILLYGSSSSSSSSSSSDAPTSHSSNNNTTIINATTIHSVQYSLSNISVLGGHVSSLVKLQHAALQQAALVAGVGVDPTIRALIGNAEIVATEMEQEGTKRCMMQHANKKQTGFFVSSTTLEEIFVVLFFLLSVLLTIIIVCFLFFPFFYSFLLHFLPLCIKI
jgi:hypothetical protein